MGKVQVGFAWVGQSPHPEGSEPAEPRRSVCVLCEVDRLCWPTRRVVDARRRSGPDIAAGVRTSERTHAGSGVTEVSGEAGHELGGPPRVDEIGDALDARRSLVPRLGRLQPTVPVWQVPIVETPPPVVRGRRSPDHGSPGGGRHKRPGLARRPLWQSTERNSPQGTRSDLSGYRPHPRTFTVRRAGPISIACQPTGRCNSVDRGRPSPSLARGGLVVRRVGASQRGCRFRSA